MRDAIDIEGFEPRTAPDELVATAHAVVTAAYAADAPDDEPPTLAAFTSDLRHRPSFLRWPHWLACLDDGEPVGVARLELSDLPDNRLFAELDIDVAPAARRRGVGSALLAEVLAAAAADGRTLPTAYALLDGAGPAFLGAHGFTFRQRERRSRLMTADVDRRLLADWIDRAAERADDYSLVTWSGPCPEEHLAGYARVSEVMNTAPLDDIEFEDMVITPKRVRAVEATLPARGIEPWTVCARHDPSGELVGFTELRYYHHRPARAEQSDTGVDPAHRRRGLGRWLKAVNLLRLLDSHPEVEAVSTWNAESNDSMLNLNVAMGFHPWQDWGAFQPGAAPGAG
jgi:GNAT superfamily N-acetyltransferase